MRVGPHAQAPSPAPSRSLGPQALLIQHLAALNYISARPMISHRLTPELT
jgi:hypothetical protein